MNFKLIFGLSLFGVGMALATVWFIPSVIEPFCWLAIYVACAWQIAKYAPRRYFLHGFLISILNCVWITGIHIILLNTYLAHHAKEAAQYTKLDKEIGLTPTMAMLVLAPFIGTFFGMVLGLFAIFARGIWSDR